jgi:cytochrome P450
MREALQSNELFSSEATMVTDPDPAYRLLPLNLNPPEHMKYRRLLNEWFLPAGVDKRLPLMRQSARGTVDAIIQQVDAEGSCDFMADFGDIYPAKVFLTAIGLGLDDADRFIHWVRTIFAGFWDPDPRAVESMGTAMSECRQYFVDLVADRRSTPRDPAADLVSHLVHSTVDGEPVSDEVIEWLCMTLVLAGLDTVRSQLGYTILYLAQHDDHRRRLAEDFSLIPTASEEFLRLFAFVPPGRKVLQDVDFHGCPMKRGQMVYMPLGSGTRDPHEFHDPDIAVLDRKPNRHIAFGSGSHRCAGAHLARQELVIALEEILTRIPNLQLVDGAVITEHGGQAALNELPITWDPATVNAAREGVPAP